MGFESINAHEALVVSGCCHARPLQVLGPGNKWVWPGQKCQRVCLKTFTLNVNSKEVKTSQGIPISCVGVAQVKVQANNMDMFRSACSIFLDKPASDIEKVAMETLEGYQNTTISSMTLEEIYFNRKKFCTQLFDDASAAFYQLGIVVVSYTLKTVTDNQGYLADLGKKRAEEARAREALST